MLSNFSISSASSGRKGSSIWSLIAVLCKKYRGVYRIGTETPQKHAENLIPQDSMQFSIYKGL